MFFLFLSACCRNVISPILTEPQHRIAQSNTELHYNLADLVIDSSKEISELEFTVQSSNSQIHAEIINDQLRIFADDDYNGEGEIILTALDKCDQQGVVEFSVTFGLGDVSDKCLYEFSYDGDASSVAIAGEFNNWDPTSHFLEEGPNGSWQGKIPLDEGSYAYKLVVDEQWRCDPNEMWSQCDAGQDFSYSCELGNADCNSIAVVQCTQPTLELENITINSNAVDLQLSSSANIESLQIQIDGRSEALPWSTDIQLLLEDGPRHSIDITGISSTGEESQLLHIPFWTDDFDWNRAVLYFVFVDRFANGDSSNDQSYGSNWSTGDYMGGDWRGVIEKLDYLEDLGVTALWLTSPQDNPEGLFDGSCGMSITGYHGYWPTHNQNLEAHFGTEDDLQELISKAHQRGIRVLVDWVGNHTHQDHPWVTEHPEWFTEYHLCTENDNWNQAPETCWFAPYVPTIAYDHSEVMVQNIQDAVDLAKKFDFDGFRVDAVKHMPKAVHWNLEQQIQQHLEHRQAGSPMEFYTVGETFSGDRGLLSAYIGDDFLDGQFDFALYWSILQSIARNESPLYTLEEEYHVSYEMFEGHIMSNFLGNHDVERFISHAAGEVQSLYGDGLCPTGNWRGPATFPDWEEPYQRLQLAWTWLMTHSGANLVYYGDEIGLPGYHDPDNRQMMPWDWSSWSQGQWLENTHNHLQTLALARQDYPQLSSPETTIWWGYPDENVLGYAKSTEGQHALIVMNRSGEYRDISNGLSWAGLPTSGSIRNILTGESMVLNGDSLSLTLPPFTSQVWIWQ